MRDGGPRSAIRLRWMTMLVRDATRTVLVGTAETIARVLYPELARLVASGDRATLARVMARTTGIALDFAALLVAIAAFAGPLLLQLLAGRAYRFAHLYLLPLTIAAAIDLSGFALEPLLTAKGRVGQILRIRVTGAACYGTLLAVLLPALGTTGAGLATVATSLTMRLQVGWAVPQASR